MSADHATIQARLGDVNLYHREDHLGACDSCCVPWPCRVGQLAIDASELAIAMGLTGDDEPERLEP